MDRTEIVDGPHQIHLRLERYQRASQVACPPRQGRTPFAKGRIQSFDARRTRDHAARCAAQHPGYPFSDRQSGVTPRAPDVALAHFDHLDQYEPWPAAQARAAWLPPPLRLPKYALGRRPIVPQPIRHH